MKGFLLSICAAVTFTVLLVSGNTMAMSVRERVREVGVLKTLGFTREAIPGMILGESIVLAFVGGVIGIGIAAGLRRGGAPARGRSGRYVCWDSRGAAFY